VSPKLLDRLVPNKDKSYIPCTLILLPLNNGYLLHSLVCRRKADGVSGIVDEVLLYYGLEELEGLLLLLLGPLMLPMYRSDPGIAILIGS